MAWRELVKATLAVLVMAGLMPVLYMLALHWNAPPTINIPIPGAYTAQEVHVSCASVGCHYYRGYTAYAGREDSVQLFRAHQWQCQEIYNRSGNGGLFGFSTPYWQCEDPAFARGSAYVAIDSAQPATDQVQLAVYVFWSD